MGKILPGIFVAFENPKGGTGKSTLTALFAGYVHESHEQTGLTIGVVDIDDAQNTMGELRAFDEAQQEEDIKDEYEVMSISSSDFINSIEFLKESFDIIVVDFPGNLKQAGVVETLMMMDVVIIPFAPSKIEVLHTVKFYNYYKENILSKRESLGYKTIVKGLPNKVTPNLLEYKELIANKDNLPFELLNNHIKESKVNYQRNLSTIINNYNHTCDDFGEEMIQLLINYVKNEIMAEEKKNTGKPKTSMFALVQAGKEEAKKVQSIKSVSSQQTSEEKIPEVQPAASTTEPAKVVAPVQEEEIIQENENMTEEPSEFPESSFPKGLSLLFAKREIIDTETIKIPREFHQELKILSTMSKVPMMQMLGNLLEAFLEENKKEIASYKRKFINGTLGKK